MWTCSIFYITCVLWYWFLIHTHSPSSLEKQQIPFHPFAYSNWVILSWCRSAAWSSAWWTTISTRIWWRARWWIPKSGGEWVSALDLRATAAAYHKAWLGLFSVFSGWCPLSEVAVVGGGFPLQNLIVVVIDILLYHACYLLPNCW